MLGRWLSVAILLGGLTLAKSRHAKKHDGSFRKLKLLRLVDGFSD
jgi:hypothetical protein